MNLEDIYIVSHKRISLPQDEIAGLKRPSNCKFPDDFCDFLQTMGPGEYCGTFFFLKPADLLSGQATFHQVLSDNFPFNRDKSALSQEEALRSTWVGRTLDGDELVYRAEGNAGFYLLPRHSDVILRIGSTIVEVLEWFAFAGILYRPQNFPWFCTFKDRCRLHLASEDELNHVEALSLIDSAFGVSRAGLDENEEFSLHFSKEISGYVHVYGEDLDFHYDLDFDAKVSEIAQQSLVSRGFRLIEHYHLPSRT